MSGNRGRNIGSPFVNPQHKVAHGFLPSGLILGSSLKRLFSATRNSLRGVADGFKTEPALRDEAILLVVAVPLGLVVAPGVAWYLAMIGVVLVLLAVEFLNTAVEKLADHVTPELNNHIRRIKDWGSAAVFCMLCLTGLIWLAALAVRAGWL